MGPSEKRIAIEVEDHPIEYADFEGIIPQGNYGAGAAIVWDRGHWVSREDPSEGLASGKLHFDLRGHKLHGTWLLIRTKDDPKSWLIMRKFEKGAPAADMTPPGEESILSGLLVEELRGGVDRAAELRAQVEGTGARRAEVDPMRVGLMLAEIARKPFSAPGWIYEIKYDGYRALGTRADATRSGIRSRGGEDMTGVFPEISRALATLPYHGLVLDGELVVLNDEGHPDFHALQRRGQMRRRIDVEQGARENPVTYFVFDLLAIEGFDLRDRPLLERKSLLRRVLPRVGLLRYCDHIEERGIEMFEVARKMDLEGVIAKKADAPYVAGRSGLWQKLVADRTDDFVVIGYTAMSGKRETNAIGALLLALPEEGGGWRYAGRAGTGFTDAQRSELFRDLEKIHRKQPVCPLPAGEKILAKNAHWVEPRMVIAVRYRNVTEGGMLRAPVFVRMREDKEPSACLDPAGPVDPIPVRREKKVAFSHLRKIFWPDDALTKGDLIDYYRFIAPRMLPYLEDRPVVLTRYPDGIAGKSFFQKDAPDHAPDWIRTARIYSAHVEREISYFICDDVEDLLYLANMASIPIHVWSSRVATISNPDWCILDLDPKGAPFAHVIRLALAIRDLCEEIRVPSFVKTTGSTGLHILIPLPPRCTYEQSRLLAQLLCGIIEGRHPEISTTARSIPARKGRVYLDALQNRHGQLLVAPYSVRPLPTAPVSAPLDWREVNDRLEPRAFTIGNMRERIALQEKDPMGDLLRTRPDLLAVLERLGAKIEKASKPARR
jgi:bifunctional non-homologous end joining protein LigD